MKITQQIRQVMPPPVSLANALRAQCPSHIDLLDLSQAVPGYPPCQPVINAGVAALCDPATHKYAPALGFEALRVAHAEAEGVPVDQVAITAGCNQAFAATLQCLAERGRSVLVPTPYYFNHQMTLTMQGFHVIEWPCREDMGLDWEALPNLLQPDTCAIVLVSPNNPTGYVTPADDIARLLRVAEQHDCALVLDETYRDFIDAAQRPTTIASDHLIRLYSFSKAYAIAGERVGAVIAAPELIQQIEKVIDCWAICAPKVGQIMALAGIGHAGDWLSGWRERIQARERLMLDELAGLVGYRVASSGAYFAWLRYPGDRSSTAEAEYWIKERGILALPAAVFGSAEAALRLAFANLDEAGITELGRRLRA